MQTTSKLGTITWVDPEYYINYEPSTGQIISIGLASSEHANFKISVEQATVFTSGTLNSEDYRVVNENGTLSVIKKSVNLAVSKTYPIKTQLGVFSKLKIIRSRAARQWKIDKLVNETVFLFLCKTNSSQHYIRTLAIDSSNVVIPMIYDSELDDVDLYTKEQYSAIEFIDE